MMPPTFNMGPTQNENETTLRTSLPGAVLRCDNRPSSSSSTRSLHTLRSEKMQRRGDVSYHQTTAGRCLLDLPSVDCTRGIRGALQYAVQRPDIFSKDGSTPVPAENRTGMNAFLVSTARNALGEQEWVRDQDEHNGSQHTTGRLPVPCPSEAMRRRLS